LPNINGPDKEVLKDYISILNQRDSMMGSVFHTVDSLNYEDDMSNVYYGSLTVAIIDLMWRSAMLDRFIGTNGNIMREAVIFYDMDRLDAPTIGAFV
ncbi:MAG: YkgJ family cysteine cluster protein, partial [Methanomassiliicoccaceae archaeon]|nr:YkgJ family cysteine cluster protein [Methanomassiliicoccaceae archaeon]